MDSDLSRAVYASETATADDRGAIRFRVVRDFGDTLSVTFRFLRENGRELGLALLVIAGPAALLANGAGGVVQARMYTTMANPANATDPFAVFRMLGSPAYLLALVLGMVAPFLVLALTFAYVRGYRRGEAGTLTPSRLWAEAQGMVGPLLLFYLATTAVVVLGAVVNIIPCLGTLAYLAGMVYLFPMSSVAFVVRAEEGLGIVDSWKRAQALVRPHWGQSVAVIFLSWLLLFVVMTALAIVTTVPQMMAGGLAGGLVQPPLVVTVLTALVASLLVLAYTIPFAASVFQYHTLVERASGTGFGADIAALAAPTRPPEPDPTFTARPAPPAAASSAAPTFTAHPAVPGTTPDAGFRDTGFRDGAVPTATAPPSDAAAASPVAPPADSSAPRGFRGGGFDGPTTDDR